MIIGKVKKTKQRTKNIENYLIDKQKHCLKMKVTRRQRKGIKKPNLMFGFVQNSENKIG